MYYVSGSNIHGQWFGTQNLISLFQEITLINCDTIPQNLEKTKLEAVTWSYNIFRLEDVFYITGAWLGRDTVVVEVTLPKECVDTKSNLVLVGNDYKLFVINIKTFEIWILCLNDAESWNWKPKKIYCNIETLVGLQEPVSKKNKSEREIKKVIATLISLYILTSDGAVFELPNCLDTSHCLGKVCDIDLGYEHGILLTDAGKVYTWGNGRRCQLGHGDLISVEEPTEVEALAGIKISKVRAGGWHTLALSEYGDLYSWGWNDSGQLGIKDLKSHPVPSLVDLHDENGIVLDVNIEDISCGSKHSAILLEDKTVWTSGSNKYGQSGFCTENYETINYFKKTASSCHNGQLLCGPWCTVIMDKC